MGKNSFCAIFHAFGSPEEVLELGPAPGGEIPPGPGEVRVSMRYSPVNPADINLIEGTYGVRPPLPAVPGNEGVGIVEAIGEGVSGLEPGDAVVPLTGGGNWNRSRVVPARDAFKLPPGIDLKQASMLRVNPVTAWQLLHDCRKLEPGETVLQNAANSGVGRAVIQLARENGWRTVNFVRRESLIGELSSLGADHVFLDSQEGAENARVVLESSSESPAPLALNAVGGDSALRLMDLLSPNGTHVTYGAMSRRSLKVPNKFLIFKNITVRGLWVSRWFHDTPLDKRTAVLSRLAHMMVDGRLGIAVDEVYPLEEVKEAVAQASQSGRNGKILIDCGE